MIQNIMILKICFTILNTKSFTIIMIREKSNRTDTNISEFQYTTRKTIYYIFEYFFFVRIIFMSFCSQDPDVATFDQSPLVAGRDTTQP